MMNDKHELAHWGIKGMRWGHRRYQNKDGSLTPAGKKRYDNETPDDFIKKVGKDVMKTGKSERLDKLLADAKAGRGKAISEGKKKKAAERAEEAKKKAAEEEAKKKSKDKNDKDDSKNKESDKNTVKEETKQVKDVNKTNIDFAKISGAASTTAKGLGKANEANTAIARIKNRKQAQQEMSTMDNKQLREKIERLNLEQQYSNLTSSRMSKGHQYVKNTLDVAVPLVEVAASAAAIAAIFMKKK